MKKIALLLALLMVFGALMTSCGEKESGGLTIDPTATAASDGTQIITGLLDESITIPATVTKIAAVSPAAKIIFESLGASSQLVDASASPEIIFVDEADAGAYEGGSVPVLKIPLAASVADISNLIRIAGKVCGKNADELVSKVTNVLNVAQLGSSAYTTKFRTYLDLGGKTVGGGTYISEMLYASGLQNIAEIDGFGTMTDADIITADPEFIFTTGSASDYLNNAAYAEVSAVKNGYVYELKAEDIIYGSSNVSNAVSQMYEKVSNTRGDE